MSALDRFNLWRQSWNELFGDTVIEILSPVGSIKTDFNIGFLRGIALLYLRQTTAIDEKLLSPSFVDECSFIQNLKKVFCCKTLEIERKVPFWACEI